MMRHLSNELSRLARLLIKLKGNRPHKGFNVVLVYDLILPELTIDCSVQNTLMIEETVSGKLIYVESPNGTILRTSPDEELAAAIEILQKYTVLDDLASI